MPSYHLLTSPALEPVTLDEIKAWLKIDSADEDLLLKALIVSARLAVEAATGLMLITQTWRLALTLWPPSNGVHLVYAPLQRIGAFRIYDVNGAPVDLPVTMLDISLARRPKLQLNSSLPPSGKALDGIEIDLVLGYGDQGSSVPEPLKLAIKMLVAFWHEHRGDDLASAALRWPDAISSLLSPFMPGRL